VSKEEAFERMRESSTMILEPAAAEYFEELSEDDDEE